MPEIEKNGIEFLEKTAKLNSLIPSKETNTIFKAFCSHCIQSTESVKNKQLIEKTSLICGDAECEMERFWAKEIINHKAPEEQLKKFWYYENYKKLTELEYINLNFFCKNIKNILFVGSGPLPFTAFFLAKKGIHITLVDYDEEALELSKKIISSCNIGKENFSFIQADAKTFTSETEFDIVYGASLIFQNKEHDNILKNIKNIRTKYFIFRTSCGGKKLLYKPLCKNTVNQYFTPQLIVHPKNDIVNSFIIVTNK